MGQWIESYCSKCEKETYQEVLWDLLKCEDCHIIHGIPFIRETREDYYIGDDY